MTNTDQTHTYHYVARHLPHTIRDRYLSYMVARWPNEERLLCKTGYAQEWADRFAQGREYQCRDTEGRRVLAKMT